MANIKLGGTVVASESGGTVTLDSGVQDNITRLGTVASGTMNNTIGSSATFPAGHILQVVSNHDSTAIANTSADSDVSLHTHAITNVLASSKVFIIISGWLGKSNMNGGIELHRNGASVLDQTTSIGKGFWTEDDSYMVSDHSISPFGWSVLDSSPATGTNTYLLTTIHSTTVYWNRAQNNSNTAGITTMTLFEVAA